MRYEVDEHGRQTPVEIVRVLVSTQHAEGVDAETIKEDVIEHVLHPILDPRLYDERRLHDDRDFVYVNPTGKFVIGGPMGDTGLTGRKIIVDTYGGAARHGGGAFSGKDPTKVDRSAAYAARYVAKNLVAAGLADRAEVNVAYAIGVAHPVSVTVRTFDTEHVPVARIEELIGKHFDLRPAAILRDLELRRPIYAKTAAYGHFGRDDHDFSWERVDKAAMLRAEAGLDGDAPGRGADRRRGARRLTEPPRTERAAAPRSELLRAVAIGALVLVGAYVVFGALGGCLPSFDNPFRTETRDRSSPVVLKSIQDLERFQAATGHFEVIVDLEKDTRFVPSAIRGERVLFVAVGDVEAGVDFRGTRRGRRRRSDGRRTVELELPHAEFFDATVDPTRSYVYDRDRGLIDRVASLRGQPDERAGAVPRSPSRSCSRSAQSGSGILARAEQNTRRMLTGLLRALGFTSVTIRFVDAVHERRVPTFRGSAVEEVEARGVRRRGGARSRAGGGARIPSRQLTLRANLDGDRASSGSSRPRTSASTTRRQPPASSWSTPAAASGLTPSSRRARPCFRRGSSRRTDAAARRCWPPPADRSEPSSTARRASCGSSVRGRCLLCGRSSPTTLRARRSRRPPASCSAASR